MGGGVVGGLSWVDGHASLVGSRKAGPLAKENHELIRLQQYEYRLHTYCGDCILIALEEDAADNESTEDVIDRLAGLRGIDRNDTMSYSMMDFPKQTNTPIEDSCAYCGMPLTIGEMQ